MALCDLTLLRRRFLRNRKRQISTLLLVLVIASYAIYSYLGLPFVKIENMDLPLVGDFSCKGSEVPGKCAFHLKLYTRVPSKGKMLCSLMGFECKGFVYNSGVNLVILKNSIKGSPKYSLGFELYVKKSYMNSINITVEECAPSSKDELPPQDSGMACHIPKLDPFDKTILGLMQKKKLDCPGKPVTTYDGSKLTFLTEDNDLDQVTYETMTRENNDFGYGVGQRGTLTRSKNTVTLNHDAVRVIYKDHHGNKQTDFHIGVSPLPEVTSRQGVEPYIPLDILILAFDSTSRSHFIRKMPVTRKFLDEKLNHVVFNGYSIVGDGTTPAITALLVGKSEEELPEARKAKGGDYVDKWPFIFNNLHKHGYVTSWSEDQAKYASLQYRLKGFVNKPVDHFLRNFWVAASEHTDGKETLCLGPEPSYKKRFRYLKSFYKSYPKKRKFALSFFAIGHDDVNALGFVDEDLAAFLEDMNNSGNLDNTMLVVMGDHGIRYGAIRKTILGKLEERLPLLSVSVPKWFKEKYPKFVHNLDVNTDRLTSPYDLHATLQQILSKSHEKTYSFGQSLFTEISKSRTCKEAGNPEHFCPCIDFKAVNPRHKHLQQIGEEAVRYINQLLKDENLLDQCALLTLQKIEDSVYLTANDKVEKFERSADVDGRVVAEGSRPKGMCNYQAQVVTSPNNGIYEVTGHVSSMTPHVNPQMSRLDKYGDQPKCIMDSHPHMRKFCYCRNKQ